jgi:hypothetical protein
MKKSFVKKVPLNWFLIFLFNPTNIFAHSPEAHITASFSIILLLFVSSILIKLLLLIKHHTFNKNKSPFFKFAAIEVTAFLILYYCHIKFGFYFIYSFNFHTMLLLNTIIVSSDIVFIKKYFKSFISLGLIKSLFILFSIILLSIILFGIIYSSLGG